MTHILGRKSFAVLLVNFTDSTTPTPFSLAQAQAASDTIKRYWQYDPYGKVNHQVDIDLGSWRDAATGDSGVVDRYRTRGLDGCLRRVGFCVLGSRRCHRIARNRVPRRPSARFSRPAASTAEAPSAARGGFASAGLYGDSGHGFGVVHRHPGVR